VCTLGENMKDPARGHNHDLVDMETLRSRCLGNSALIERVLQAFTMQLDADMQELQRAFSSGDTIACARVSHRIKGMAANVEARSLSHHAAVAERCAQENSLGELSVQLAHMQQERHRLINSLAPCGAGAEPGCDSSDVSVP
jgi:HPt (histidine-containing phosphotransfer) domain-containing protein